MRAFRSASVLPSPTGRCKLRACNTDRGNALCTGRGRCAPRRQSLLRSCLASRSFPRRPPAYVLSALGTSNLPTRVEPRSGGEAPSGVIFGAQASARSERGQSVSRREIEEIGRHVAPDIQLVPLVRQERNVGGVAIV